MATANPPLRRGVRLLPRLRQIRPPRVTPMRIGVLVAVIAVIAGGWMWFRSSSLVAVHQVEVTGVSGANAPEIRSTLASTAERMTTLDISTTKLKQSVSGYGHIAAVTVSTHFPHGVTIRVDETNPVATISSGEGQVAVDGAGQLLPRDSTAGLPALAVAPASGTDQVTTKSTLGVLSVLQAAPYQMLPHIKSARTTDAHGITVTLRNGPIIYFGSTADLPLKWKSADATLASSYSVGATYIDVTAPHRPAAG